MAKIRGLGSSRGLWLDGGQGVFLMASSEEKALDRGWVSRIVETASLRAKKIKKVKTGFFPSSRPWPIKGI